MDSFFRGLQQAATEGLEKGSYNVGRTGQWNGKKYVPVNVIHAGQKATLNNKPVVADGQGNWRTPAPNSISGYGAIVGEYPLHRGLNQRVADASGRNEQGADLDMAAIKRLAAEFDKPAFETDFKPPVRSDDANSSDSALTSMRQQYAPGADIWSTDEGKAILEAAKTNTYGGKEQGTLAEFNTQQRQAGIGANDEIIEALGYEKGSPMATWAEAHPALAMREYNKKFGNSYEGEGSGDANSVLANGMTAGEDQALAIKNAAAIIRGTGAPGKSNHTVMAPGQSAGIQAQNNNDLNLLGVQAYMNEGVEGLGGKELLGRYADHLWGAN